LNLSLIRVEPNFLGVLDSSNSDEGLKMPKHAFMRKTASPPSLLTKEITA